MYRGKGKCYEVSFKFLYKVADMRDMKGNYILVHGTYTNEDGITVAHAWVEIPKESRVIDVANGNVWAKKAFYGHAQPIKRYLPIQAAKLVLETGHYGPWDEESLRINRKAKESAGLQ